MGRLTLVAVCLALALGTAACGDDESASGGAVTLNWWAYNEPSGSFREAADRCTQQSDGRYRIEFNPLGNDPNTQRQQLVSRLAAGDPSTDLMSMDVIWTAEFAEAGWIRPFPERFVQQLRQGTLEGPLNTAMYENRLYGAPANSNTQLLWYRKDLVDRPPGTWAEMIQMAERMREAGRIEIQGAAYEGYTVWFNSLIQGAGGEILAGPDRVALPPGPTRAALEVIGNLARWSAADPSLSTQREDQNRLAFEEGQAAFQINYPFIYSSARDNEAEIFRDIGWTTYPRTVADRPARPPIGGFNWGVGGFTEHPDQAFEAAVCLRNEENQRAYALKGGLPPTLGGLYDDPAFQREYPFWREIRDSLENAAVRPATPLYADVSLAVYTTLSPPTSVTPGLVPELSDAISNALQSKGLL